MIDLFAQRIYTESITNSRPFLLPWVGPLKATATLGKLFSEPMETAIITLMIYSDTITFSVLLRFRLADLCHYYLFPLNLRLISSCTPYCLLVACGICTLQITRVVVTFNTMSRCTTCKFNLSQLKDQHNELSREI